MTLRELIQKLKETDTNTRHVLENWVDAVEFGNTEDTIMEFGEIQGYLYGLHACNFLTWNECYELQNDLWKLYTS